MNLFGIPVIIPYSAYMTFLGNFSEYSTFDTLILCICGLYLVVLYRFCINVLFLLKIVYFVNVVNLANV